jgi:hypothetical protein
MASAGRVSSPAAEKSGLKDGIPGLCSQYASNSCPGLHNHRPRSHVSSSHKRGAVRGWQRSGKDATASPPYAVEQP